jgi:tRNA1(Val) A37 N6-methylase TrmN6
MELAETTFCNPPYNADYANTPKRKHRGKHRPILKGDLEDDLAGASSLHR